VGEASETQGPTLSFFPLLFFGSIASLSQSSNTLSTVKERGRERGYRKEGERRKRGRRKRGEERRGYEISE
jgi:hypothetical protein